MVKNDDHDAFASDEHVCQEGGAAGNGVDELGGLP